jgi:hypothetical protein
MQPTDAGVELLSVPVLATVVAPANHHRPAAGMSVARAAVSYPCGLRHTYNLLGDLVLSEARVAHHWGRRFAPLMLLIPTAVLVVAAGVVAAAGGEHADVYGWLLLLAAPCGAGGLGLCWLNSADVTRIQAPSIPSARDPGHRSIFVGQRSYLGHLVERCFSIRGDGPLQQRSVAQVRCVTLSYTLRSDGRYATKIGLVFFTDVDGTNRSQRPFAVPLFHGVTTVPEGEAERWRVFLRPDDPDLLRRHSVLNDDDARGAAVIVVARFRVRLLTVLGLLLAAACAAAACFRSTVQGYRLDSALSVVLAVVGAAGLGGALVGGVLRVVHVTRIDDVSGGEPRHRSLEYCCTCLFAVWLSRCGRGLDYVETTVDAVTDVVEDEPGRVTLRLVDDVERPLVFEGGRRDVHRAAERWRWVLDTRVPV